MERGADAARDFPRAEKLGALLYEFTSSKYSPEDTDIEERFEIMLSMPVAVRVEEFFPQLVLVLARRIGRATVQAVLKRFDHICVKAVGLHGEASFFVSEIRGMHP